MSIAYSAFYDIILPLVPAVETPLVDQAIVRAARHIASQAPVDRRVITQLTTSGQPTYALSVGLDSELSSIYSVRMDVDGSEIKLYPAQMDVADYLSTLDSALPTHWAHYPGGDFVLYPTPDSVRSLRIVGLARPELDTTSGVLPDVYAHHREIIADGAMAFLFSAPAKPWSNEKMASAAYVRFGRAILALRARLRSGGQVNNSTLSTTAKFGA